jgi:hypothetical protein
VDAIRMNPPATTTATHRDPRSFFMAGEPPARKGTWCLSGYSDSASFFGAGQPQGYWQPTIPKTACERSAKPPPTTVY